MDRDSTFRICNCPFFIVPADKGGQLVFVPEADLCKCLIGLTDAESYKPFEQFEQTWLKPEYFEDLHVKPYAKIAQKISKLEHFGVSAFQLCRSLKQNPTFVEDLVSVLQGTMKAHKPSGHVVMRPIQNNAKSPFAGLSAWINAVLTPVLAKHNHIRHSGEDFIKKISCCSFPNNVLFFHYDLDDFFLKGDFSFLKLHTSLMAPVDVREPFREALEFLLSRQYVRTSARQGTFKGITGPGIGTKHSNTIAVAAFLHAVELCGKGLSRQTF